MVKRSSNLLFIACTVPFIVLLLVGSAAGQTSSPQLPHTFYGKILIGEASAGQGLVVEAVGPGVLSGIPGNPVTTMTGGIYGIMGSSSQKLIVQGDIEPGTPLEFFVGGVPAEVYPVATGGPWKENYSYIPGDLTELNLRIASQPSTGETRVPTPVQTRLPAEAVSGYTGTLPQPGVIETVQPGTESIGGQPAPMTPDAGSTPIGTSPPVAATTTGNGPLYPSGNQSLPTSSSPVLLIGVIVIVLIILASLLYATKKRKADTAEEKDESGEKTVVKEKE
jgi:hypothetical protein